jgi:iron(III) transport system permease protein
LCAAALIVFGITSILPVGCMLAHFVISLIRDPSAITSVLIDARQLVLLGRSLTIAVSATIVALGLGLPVAFILATGDLPFRRLFHFLVLVPVLIPSYVMAGAWIHLLGPAGLVNSTLAAVLGPAAKLSIHSTAGCAWCLGISFFPVIAIIVASGISQLDSNLTDIARLSVNRWGVFRYAVVPQILPHLAASVCLVLIFVFAQYGVPSLLGLNTYPVEVFAQFSAFYNETAAIATALPLTALVVFLILLQQRIMRTHDYVRITPSSETRQPMALKGTKPHAVAFLLILLLVTTVLPFFSVLAYAGSLAKVWSALRSYGDGIVTTSLLALLAAVVATAIAFPIGHHLARSHSRFWKTLDIVSWLPIAIPGTIIGLGVIKLANSAAILQQDSFGVLLLIAYIGMFSAFSIRIFAATWRRADPNIGEAAEMDCRRWYQRLWHIDMPINAGAIAASLMVVFVLVVGELNATVLLIPPGKATLSVSIDNLLHYGANATASALCLLEAGLVIIAISCGLLIFGAAKRALR